MSVKVNIPWFLQYQLNGVKVAEVKGNTVSECLASLTKRFPIIVEKLFDEDGKLPPYVDIYVNGENVDPEQLSQPVKDGDEIHIVTITGGG
jgi:MoaD family protein